MPMSHMPQAQPRAHAAKSHYQLTLFIADDRRSRPAIIARVFIHRMMPYNSHITSTYEPDVSQLAFTFLYF